MKLYKVGGCVRDSLMGKEPRDIDWLVVGATPQHLADLGYIQVGADFPVFLHPQTKDEYALARKERKTGLGHKGFETRFDPSVTVEEDLSRRDLTINAIAQDAETGEFIDPFGGRDDLRSGVLRHVSEAFSEDPLRILRLARFQARTGFDIHPSTEELCSRLSAEGALRELSVERVCSELRKLLECERPERAMESLRRFGAVASLDQAWPSRLEPAALGALGRAADQGLPEWAKTRLACCNGMGGEAAARFLESLRFPSDISKWAARAGHFVSWAMESLDSELSDWAGACSAMERCNAPKMSPAELEAFRASAEAELESLGADAALIHRARRALEASGAIACADLAAALASPKIDSPVAVKRAKANAFAKAWRFLETAPAPRRPKA